PAWQPHNRRRIGQACTWGAGQTHAREDAMRVLITGAGGFIGQQLVRKLLKRGELTTLSGETRPVRELILADRCIAALPFGTTHGITVSARAGDLCDRSEERRVGKESRRTRSQYHDEKKRRHKRGDRR